MKVYYSQAVVTVGMNETVPFDAIFVCAFIFYQNVEYILDIGGVYSYLMIRFLLTILETWI